MAQAFENGKTYGGNCTYTQEDLPVDNNKVVTIDKIKRWDHLDKMKAEVNSNDNIEVTLLVDANCIKALEMGELIASNNGGQYAFRTLLRCALYDRCTVKINLNY